MPWLDKVSAVLETWYPGQQYGTAIASLLFGDTNPSGKLPLTFPASDQQGPWGAGTLQYPGDGTNVFYSEGIDVGYRWYDAQHATPLFPFGYGLSYTSFAFSNLGRHTARRRLRRRVLRHHEHRRARRAPTSPRSTSAPARPSPASNKPSRSLRGFDRVTLDPGQTKHETITLDRPLLPVLEQPRAELDHRLRTADDLGRRLLRQPARSPRPPPRSPPLTDRRRRRHRAGRRWHSPSARPRHSGRSRPASTRRTPRPRRPTC